MLRALTNRLVLPPTWSVRLADPPGFASLSATAPGLGLIREIGFEVESLPGQQALA